MEFEPKRPRNCNRKQSNCGSFQLFASLSRPFGPIRVCGGRFQTGGTRAQNVASAQSAKLFQVPDFMYQNGSNCRYCANSEILRLVPIMGLFEGTIWTDFNLQNSKIHFN